MITILGGEIFSALGEKKERLKLFSTGKYKTVTKKIIINSQEILFPYYCIDERDRKNNLDVHLHYLEDIVQKAICNLSLTQTELSRCGLFVGNSSNDLSLSILLGNNFDGSQEDQIECERIGNGFYADHLIKYFGLNNFSLTYNTACTSSSNAVIDAASMLEGGVIDYALVLGIELFAKITFEGFASMQLLSQGKYAPFDRDRDGIVLGESLSALFLSRSDIAASPWYFLGGISSCETHSVTGAKSDGEGIAEVIRSVLEITDFTKNDITAVKTHGTASDLNDLAEINGMKQIFSEMPHFFSLKPYIGHTLGSCGTSEIILMMECIDAGFIPGTPNFINKDVLLGWTPSVKKTSCSNGRFLLNYFGFGGNNTSIIVEKVQT